HELGRAIGTSRRAGSTPQSRERGCGHAQRRRADQWPQRCSYRRPLPDRRIVATHRRPVAEPAQFVVDRLKVGFARGDGQPPRVVVVTRHPKGSVDTRYIVNRGVFTRYAATRPIWLGFLLIFSRYIYRVGTLFCSGKILRVMPVFIGL